ncbi:hypothetical protein Bca101_067665 [Brassica carinata]
MPQKRLFHCPLHREHARIQRNIASPPKGELCISSESPSDPLPGSQSEGHHQAKKSGDASKAPWEPLHDQPPELPPTLELEKRRGRQEDGVASHGHLRLKLGTRRARSSCSSFLIQEKDQKTGEGWMQTHSVSDLYMRLNYHFFVKAGKGKITFSKILEYSCHERPGCLKRNSIPTDKGKKSHLKRKIGE